MLFRSGPVRRAGVYRFRGAAGPVEWPKVDGAGLGAAGAWNFLWRLGAQPQPITPQAQRLPSGAILFAVVDDADDPSTHEFLSRWHAHGNTIVAAGAPAAFALHLPAGAATARSPYPFAALAYRLDQRVEPMAPPAWSYARWDDATSGAGEGELVALGGERQSPARATALPLAAPALVYGDRFVYLNANPFAAFQAWLQGQSDLGPWLAWRPRLFWLDEHVAALWRVLLHAVPALGSIPRPGVSGLGATTVVLRHDLDYSRDTAYLELETARGVPASYAVLLDRNRRFWTARLAGVRAMECCYHYNTIDRKAARADAIARRMRRLLGGTSREPVTRPALGEIAGGGLKRQVARARAGGVGIATLHRHGAFLVYPEWLDALDACLRAFPEIGGSSSLFRGTVLRWGARRIDGNAGTLIDFPDAGFPLWWPFKLARADAATLLRGWESTSVAECEPELVAQMLDHRIPELPQRVITLSYHPYHAARATFRPAGSVAWFAAILDLVAARGVEVLTLAEVYARVERESGVTN
ncbi:MAG TPA: hypothetical protein VMU87_22365 [Stellaceae bacterium]|nr:hypothetical protein [Stellaceae bacterium]